MWFPREAAERLLRDVEAARSYREFQVPLLDRRVEIEKERANLLLENLHLTEQIAGQWKEAFESFVGTHIQLAVHWYETPTFWFGMGVVGTGLLAIGLSFGLGR